MTSRRSVKPAATPLHRSGPPARSSAGQEAVELAASAGLILDPWQCDVVESALGERADGRWAAREVGLIVPRQNGKGSILEAVELAGLFLFDEELILHSAHEFKTAGEAYLRIRTLIQQTPDLDCRVKTFHNAHGSEGVELKNGHRLRFVARTGGSGRGFSGDRIILDEAYNLSDKAISALMPTMAARPNPQIWYTSSAPLVDDSSKVLRRLCKRGREGSPTLDYHEFCVPDDADLDDPEAWAQANPGFPHRIDRDTIEMERGAMLADDFARERLGIWTDPADNVNQVLPALEWDLCRDSESGIDGDPCFALEVSEDQQWSCFAAAGRSTLGGFIHGEIVQYSAGTGWVVARAVALKAKWGGKLAIAKSSPAAALIPELYAAGFREEDIDIVSTEDHARACGQLLNDVLDGRFRHRDQPALDVAVRGAVKRDVGDVWVWSRRRSSVDIGPLVAVTLATGRFGSGPAPKNTAVPDFIVVG